MEPEYPFHIATPNREEVLRFLSCDFTEQDFLSFDILLPIDKTPHILKGLKDVKRIPLAGGKVTRYELSQSSAALVKELYDKKKEEH
ncbi:hypothetical protein E8E11_005033 [Didymella keratinophila]|nr:hypothetical protein E8E11_005033 [Didymella keratinophila]